jgi:hypothetical protein
MIEVSSILPKVNLVCAKAHNRNVKQLTKLARMDDMSTMIDYAISCITVVARQQFMHNFA